MSNLTADDCVALIKQAQHAGEYFADMIADSGEPESYSGSLDSVDTMLDGHPLYLAGDRDEIEYGKIPPVIRKAMTYVAWKALHEHSEELGPPRSHAGGKARAKRTAARHSGGAAKLVAAASALKAAWR